MYRSSSTLAAVAAVALSGSFSLAATSWSTPSGSSDTITYTNGQTQNGLLTDSSPTVVNNLFIFTPANFSATSAVAPTANDIASAIITAKPGQSLSHVTAGLGGDYSLLGVGATDAIGTLTVTNVNTHEVLTQAFNFGGPFTGQPGSFSDNVSINLPSGWLSAEVDLSAGLTASAAQGTSFIQYKTAQFGVDTVKAAAVPLPPAALASIPALLIAGFAIRRKRASC